MNAIGNREVVLHPDAQIPRMGFLDYMPRDHQLNGVDPVRLAQLLMRGERPPQFFHEIHGVNDHFGHNTQYRHQLIQNLQLDEHVPLPGLQRGTRPDGLPVAMAPGLVDGEALGAHIEHAAEVLRDVGGQVLNAGEQVMTRENGMFALEFGLMLAGGRIGNMLPRIAAPLLGVGAGVRDMVPAAMGGQLGLGGGRAGFGPMVARQVIRGGLNRFMGPAVPGASPYEILRNIAQGAAPLTRGAPGGRGGLGGPGGRAPPPRAARGMQTRAAARAEQVQQAQPAQPPQPVVERIPKPPKGPSRAKRPVGPEPADPEMPEPSRHGMTTRSQAREAFLKAMGQAPGQSSRYVPQTHRGYP
jgi:hypothetical protein